MANTTPPPQIGERFGNWCQKRRRGTKIIIGLGCFLVLIVIISIARTEGRTAQQPPVPTPTLSQQQQSDQEERHREYVDRMRFACSYAIAGNFDRDQMIQLAEYDYGTYGGIIMKSYLQKKDVASQCRLYR